MPMSVRSRYEQRLRRHSEPAMKLRSFCESYPPAERLLSFIQNDALLRSAPPRLPAKPLSQPGELL